MQINLITIFIVLFVIGLFGWFLLWNSFWGFIASKCQSAMWKIRDDFVDTYLIKDKIELKDEDREYVWKGVKGFDEINTSSPIVSYILYRFGYNWDWNFIQSVIKDAQN